MRSHRLTPWELIPGLGASLGQGATLLGASSAFKALQNTRGLTADWTSLMTETSRLDLLDRLQHHEDFQITLMLAATEQADSPAPPRWLMCEGWWNPEAEHHVCYFADTTAIEQSRQTAQTRTNRIKVLFEHLPVKVASIGPRPLGLCQFANRQFAQLFGFNENSIIGVPVMEMAGEKVVVEVRAHIRRLLDTRQPVTFEHEVQSAAGPVVWHEVSIAFASEGWTPGSETGFHFLITDVTERHRAELALRESEDRLSRFMDASAEGVLFHRDGLITDVNPAASRVFGAPVEQLLGRSAMELVAPEYRARAASVIAAGADASYESEIFNVHGVRIPVEIIGRSMLRNGEQLRMAVVRDIRDRREAQARINELIQGLRAEKDKAEAADRAKSVFLAAASHDLRQPIHALSLFLTALRSMSQSPSVRSTDLAEICRRMQSSLDGLGQLLNMLLDVSRLDANAVQVERAPTSAQRLLEDLDQDFHQLACEKGLQLHVCSSRLWVDTDPTVLRRILGNLVSNAVRYTPRGRVLIGCRLRGAEVEFQVWDSGIGIPPEQRDAIFEEFFQIGQTPAARHESHGLGLGLSIVKRSALLLHAPLDLRSIPGRGSMFSIRIPRCPPPAFVPEPQPDASFEHTQASLGVLVIDDDEQVLAAMRSVLGVWGHRVFCATSPDEAVVIAISHASDIDLLISDYRLGGNVTAIEAIRAVHACLPGAVPTYILTGDTSPQRILEASLLGFPLLHKPIDALALRAILGD